MKTQRTKLNLLTEADYEDLLTMFEEPGAFQYIKHLENKTREQYKEYLSLKQQEIASGKGYYWVARNLETSSLIGGVNLTPIPKTNQVQIGWMISSAHRRKGYAYEVAHKVLEFALKETDFRPIYAVFEKENVASEKIIKKLNFSFLESKIVDGIDEERYIYQG
ncbi:GNAT family N-acetyltransferase [Rapidithrix thailandica]|uniref:GNAT family N-acetyltransferase n=1 Tax=Rapidithrix thailandica TaxID=413964 RepID=A0AAW9RY39_9BACT